MNNSKNSSSKENLIKNQTFSQKSSAFDITINSISSSELIAEAESNNYLYELNVIVNESSSLTTLSISDNQETLYDHSFSHDLTYEYPRLHVRNEIVEKANNIYSDYLSLSDEELNLIDSEIFILASAIRDELDSELQLMEVGQAFYYHSAIIKTLTRKIEENSNECNCETYIPFLEGESPFVCTEDLIMNTNDVHNRLNGIYDQYDSTQVDSSGLDSVISYTANNPSTNISQYQVHQIIMAATDDSVMVDSTTNAPIIGCLLLSGSDPGCCGNYSGACWFCNLACLAHDLYCWCCDVPFCGGDCGAEPDC